MNNELMHCDCCHHSLSDADIVRIKRDSHFYNVPIAEISKLCNWCERDKAISDAYWSSFGECDL